LQGVVRGVVRLAVVTLFGWTMHFLPDYAVEVEEMRDLGDVTLARIRGWDHGAASATPVVDPFWQPLRWRDGKCVWWRNCSTEAEASGTSKA
jgi:hypothetical protein